MNIHNNIIQTGRGSSRTTKCKHCMKNLTSNNLDRWKTHMRNCTEAPNDVKLHFKKNTTGKSMNISTVTLSEEFLAAKNPEMSRRCEVSSSSMKPKPLNWIDTISEEEKQLLDQDFAAFIHETGSPFELADAPSFKKFLKRLRPAYDSPSSKRVAGSLLDDGYQKLETVKNSILQEAEMVCIETDGWSNCRNEHLINYVASTSNYDHPVFLKAECSGTEQQSAKFIATGIENVIKEIGIDKVVAVVTDNAPTMQAAWSILEDKYPGLICNGCAAHVMNLLIKDICKLKNANEMLSKCKLITSFVRERGAVVERFRQLQQDGLRDGTIVNARCLSYVCDTRWYTHENCMRRVLDNKVILEMLLPQLVVQRISDSKKDNFQEIIQDSNFWKTLEKTLKLLKPFGEAIAKLESRKSPLSIVYKSFNELINLNQHNNEIKKIINDRWSFLHTESMGIAYFLDPTTTAGEDMVGTDRVDTIIQLEQFAVKKKLTQEKDSIKISEEIEKFVETVSNPQSNIKNLIENKSARIFWSIVGEKFPILKKVARLIFSIPTSQANTERIWSFYDYIHCKRRNRLATEKATKLVSIYANAILNKKNPEIQFHSGPEDSQIVNDDESWDDSDEDEVHFID